VKDEKSKELKITIEVIPDVKPGMLFHPLVCLDVN
jgi:hypothetical protein